MTTIDEVFTQVYSVIADIEEVVGILEIVIDTQTIYEEWIDADYIEAGLYTGKGVTNAYFAIFGVVSKYFIT